MFSRSCAYTATAARDVGVIVSGRGRHHDDRLWRDEVWTTRCGDLCGRGERKERRWNTIAALATGTKPNGRRTPFPSVVRTAVKGSSTASLPNSSRSHIVHFIIMFEKRLTATTVAHSQGSTDFVGCVDSVFRELVYYPLRIAKILMTHILSGGTSDARRYA